MRGKPLHCTRVTPRNAVSIYPGLCWLVLLLSLEVTATPPLEQLTLASWNIRWLNSAGFAPGHSLEGQRSKADLSTLRRYGALLDADLVGLQEIGDIKALKEIFPDERYRFFIAEQSGTKNRQKVALALRKHLVARRYREYRELGNSGGRTGLDIGIRIDAETELRILVVHLKSGCYSNRQQQNNQRALTCTRFAQDIAWVERWIDLRAQAGTPFVVLGDFNRRLALPGDAALAELDDGDPATLQLQLAAPSDTHRCAVRLWQRKRQRWAPQLARFTQPIDHFLLGGAAVSWSRRRPMTLAYQQQDAMTFNLSDHCPIRLTLSPKA